MSVHRLGVIFLSAFLAAGLLCAPFLAQAQTQAQAQAQTQAPAQVTDTKAKSASQKAKPASQKATSSQKAKPASQKVTSSQKAKPASQKAKQAKQNSGGNPENPQAYPLHKVQGQGMFLQVPAQAEQGGVVLVLVSLDPAVPELSRLQAMWQGKKYTLSVQPATQQHPMRTAMVMLPMGVDVTSKSGDLSLEVVGTVKGGKANPVRGQASIKVMPVNWPRQNITVAQNYVTPPQELTQRIAADRERTKVALGKVSAQRFWALPFTRPVPGSVSSAFGGKRVFNGEARSYHKGVDLRGAAGTPVLALGAGTVLLAEEQYFSGNVVYVDHGQGLVTVYAHLSAFSVKPGDTVTAGQQLGLVGATGRVTGPHLHLSALLMGQSVNPLALLATSGQ